MPSASVKQEKESTTMTAPKAVRKLSPSTSWGMALVSRPLHMLSIFGVSHHFFGLLDNLLILHRTDWAGISLFPHSPLLRFHLKHVQFYFFEQHATNTCSFYFYSLPCITCMLHASDACLSFMMLRIMLSLHCQTHVEHALTICYTHVLLYINNS